ncbi:MAG: hypothetical protein AB7I48_20500 [Planctomycetaceae bacterium]
MFEKLNQFAEQAATRASRRQFLGRFGRGAMAAAAAVGWLLVLPADTAAATVCGPGSISYCKGRPIGSPCGSARGPRGICVLSPNCTCRTCPRGSDWQSCSNGAKICCPRGYNCYVRRGQAACRRSA